MVATPGVIVRRAVAFILLSGSPLAAQSQPTDPTVDTIPATRPAADPLEQHAWVGVGAGGGLSPRGALAGLAEGWYSVGGIALGARATRAGRVVGEQRDDKALLVGLRTPGKRWFFLTAIGISQLSAHRICGDVVCFPPEDRRVASPAYSIEGHGNFPFVGLGVTMFGALGPDGLSYHAVALTLNAGRFGR